MMTEKNHIPIDWSALFLGLKNDWLSPAETILKIKENVETLNCNDDTLVDFFVNDNDKGAILDLMQERFDLNEANAMKYWQLSALWSIEHSDLSVSDKLKEIEIRWASFGYPEEWRGFIYYMPNEELDSEEAVYQSFITFLNSESRKFTGSSEDEK